jgi:hypothetical protein
MSKTKKEKKMENTTKKQMILNIELNGKNYSATTEVEIEEDGFVWPKEELNLTGKDGTPLNKEEIIDYIILADGTAKFFLEDGTFLEGKAEFFDITNYNN